MNLPPFVAEKIGPLPVYGWAVLGVGVGSLVLLASHRGGGGKGRSSYTTGNYEDSRSVGYGVPANRPDPPGAPPVIGHPKPSPSLDGGGKPPRTSFMIVPATQQMTAAPSQANYHSESPIPGFPSSTRDVAFDPRFGLYDTAAINRAAAGPNWKPYNGPGS